MSKFNILYVFIVIIIKKIITFTVVNIRSIKTFKNIFKYNTPLFYFWMFYFMI